MPTALPSPFTGQLGENLSSTTFIDNKTAALVDSGARNTPPHIPIGGPFQKPPSNRSTVSQGSATVFIDGRGVARANDPAKCCNDPADSVTGHVVAVGTVFSG